MGFQLYYHKNTFFIFDIFLFLAASTLVNVTSFIFTLVNTLCVNTFIFTCHISMNTYCVMHLKLKNVIFEKIFYTHVDQNLCNSLSTLVYKNWHIYKNWLQILYVYITVKAWRPVNFNINFNIFHSEMMKFWMLSYLTLPNHFDECWHFLTRIGKRAKWVMSLLLSANRPTIRLQSFHIPISVAA